MVFDYGPTERAALPAIFGNLLARLSSRRNDAAFRRVPWRFAFPTSLAPAQLQAMMHCRVLTEPIRLQDSFSNPSNLSAFADQPTIMPRNMSHPSARTRITWGTTKKMKTHISQKCQMRALS